MFHPTRIFLVCSGLAFVGCGDDDNNNDNSTHFPTAQASVVDARYATWDYNGDLNHIACADNQGTLEVEISEDGGLADRVTLEMEGYTGLGTYEWTYEDGATTHRQVDVQVGYTYMYYTYYDFSRIDFTEVFSHCQVAVSEDTAGPAGRVFVSIDCTDLVARPESGDYEFNPVEYQPHVDVSATIHCDLQ